MPNDKEGGAAEEAVALRGEFKPLDGMSVLEDGCGMKQIRKPRCGGNRREAESAWGRNEAGIGYPCVGGRDEVVSIEGKNPGRRSFRRETEAGVELKEL